MSKTNGKEYYLSFRREFMPDRIKLIIHCLISTKIWQVFLRSEWFRDRTTLRGAHAATDRFAANKDGWPGEFQENGLDIGRCHI